MKPIILCLLILALMASACALPFALSPEASATLTATAQTATAAAWTLTPTATVTSTSTVTHTPTVTSTPTLTPTPTISPTPTYDFPDVVVNKQAHCRYGPNVAYLHAADLYAGDAGTVRGRFRLSNWLYIKFDKLGYFCWVAPSVVDVTGDVKLINFVDQPRLPGPSIYYGPPDNVVVTRDDNKVTITWDQVHMTDDKDRGYFLDIFVCQDGAYLWWPVSFPDQTDTSFTIKDEAGCPAPSGGQIYTVEKHGYSSPKNIPGWPPAP
jgi:hypothetical protein